MCSVKSQQYVRTNLKKWKLFYYYGTLADRVRVFKESKAGIEIMCQAMEDMINQTLKEGMINAAKKMLEDGTITLEKIAEFVGLSLDEVRKLKTDQNV